tara:strand:- start:147 stop:428 length:282 start_codon:yes stop_codon:yes gene_type:complete
MPLIKVVDGVEIPLTAEEEAEMEAGWAAQDLNFTQIRIQRNGLLRESDWTQLPGGPLTDEQQAAWGTYRQELRDYPSQSGLVSTLPEWPTPPE